MPEKLRTVFIGGDHRRHRYYCALVSPHVRQVGAVIQKREDILPEPPPGISERDRDNWWRHFGKRDTAEKAYFGQHLKLRDALYLKNINSPEAADYVREREPELVLIFGTGMIRQPLMSVLPKDAINLHLGLSPRYRGAATLFWPFYFLEPNHAGYTFHRIVAEPDAGEIIHQGRPKMFKTDGLHDVGARAVLYATQDMIDLLKWRATGIDWKFKRQTNTGKCFLKNDFQPQHLRMIYETFDDDIAAQYLTGRLKGREPKMYQENL